jgi:hypothetical protein
MWKDKALPEQLGNWSAVELKSRMTNDFSYRASPMPPRHVYSFKVQGCRAHWFGKDDCHGYSPTVDVLMENTRSVLEWLGGAPLSPGIRSLGTATYGQGFRSMMGI